MSSVGKNSANRRRGLLTGASVLAAAAIASTPALAQDVGEEEEAIVVTGSRLIRQDFDAISAITTVGAEQLELTATLTTDSLLNELPQIIPGNTRTSNNAGGQNFSTVDLRGLGPSRTLVIVNGERVPASSTTGVVDLNTIPASLISRIEVVTGGASAVYGSDAMAGVINFVLKDDYEGAEFNVTYGSELETGNAAEFEMNGLVGGGFANNRGNITAYASYYNRDSVSQSEYDYSRVSGAICYDSAAGFFICDTAEEVNNSSLGSTAGAGGSGTPPWGWIANDSANAFTGLSGLLPGQFAAADHDCNPATAPIAVDSGSLSFNDAGQLTPRFTAGGCGVPDRAAGSSRYSFAPDNYLIIPAERVALTTTGHYDISADLRLNVLMNYTNSRSEVQLAPTPATGLTVTLTPAMQTLISTNHPDLWAALGSRPIALAPFTMDRRMTEVGTRNSYYENNAFYFMTSLEGNVGANWDWTLSASYGQSSFITRAVNSVNRTALLQGLAGCQAANGDPLGSAALPGCVALDIFGAGTLDASMQSFLRVNTFNTTTIEENRIAGFVRGNLFELPAGPVATVFGVEYRDTFSGSYNDNEQRTGNIYGFNAIQDQEGQVDVYEMYVEASLPLLSEAPFAHYLGLEGGFRRSNYSSVGAVDTYKIGGEWAPTDWLRFRGIFNEATRAPNVFELFQAGDQGFPSYLDPCADINNDGAPDNGVTTAAFCIGTGMPGSVYPGFTQNNAQVQSFAFGNPNLSPETAESLTYGVVIAPDWFPVGDLRLSIDYYDITIDKVISTLNAQFFINDCYVNTVASSCARITRNSVTGQIDAVNTTVSNQSALSTEGVDVQLEWSADVGPGRLTINELYSILDEYMFNGVEFTGTTSAAIGGALPDYKSVLSATYNVGDWTLFGRWSYVPSMTGATVGEATPEASYFDASVRWALTDNFSMTLNVSNILDELPPQTIDGYFGQANTDTQVYQVLGRSFALSARYRF